MRLNITVSYAVHDTCIFLHLKVVMSQATHLFFDAPPEPDPEEPGLYWASRFTDTLKTFQFLPDRLYENIDTNRLGEPLTNTDVCGQKYERCPALTMRKNIIGELFANPYQYMMITYFLFEQNH